MSTPAQPMKVGKHDGVWFLLMERPALIGWLLLFVVFVFTSGELDPRGKVWAAIFNSLLLFALVLVVALWVRPARALLPWAKRPASGAKLHNRHKPELPHVERQDRQLAKHLVREWGSICLNGGVASIRDLAPKSKIPNGVIICPELLQVFSSPLGVVCIMTPTDGLTVDQVLAAAGNFESALSARVRMERVQSTTVPLVQMTVVTRDPLEGVRHSGVVPSIPQSSPWGWAK